MKKADITLFTDRASVLLVLPDDTAGRVIKEIIRRQALTEYTEQGEILDPNEPLPFIQGSFEHIAYIAIQNGIEQANAKWIQRVQKNRNSALKRWNKGTNANAMQMQCQNDNDNDNENEKENENGNNCILDKLNAEEWAEIKAHCKNIRAVTDSISDRITPPQIRRAYPYFVKVAKGLGYWE